MRRLSGKRQDERCESGTSALGNGYRDTEGRAKQQDVEQQNVPIAKSGINEMIRKKINNEIIYKDKDKYEIKDNVKFKDQDNNKDNKIVKGNTLRGLPYEERVRAYMSARNRIFGERQLEGMTLATRRILKARARFRRRRMTRRQIIEAVQRDDNTDPRVFADVEVTGRKMKGLLDTGASVSLLGRGCRELVEELEWPVQPYASMVRTVAGASRPILGRVVLPVKYKERVEEIVFYMCPDLQQELYLGIDFWRAFEIAPDVLGAPETSEGDPDVSEATVANTDVTYYRDEDDVESDPETWNLEERQVTQLEAVKREFLQFEKDGLGKTHLLQHRIQLIEGTETVKDRHYPLSPAKQEIVWAEVDKMLQLGIIEESDSLWSNRTTVVMRPGKNRFSDLFVGQCVL
ncbi:hypothetical protein ACLKA7_001875 [Drosophila subpalustris]